VRAFFIQAKLVVVTFARSLQQGKSKSNCFLVSDSQSIEQGNFRSRVHYTSLCIFQINPSLRRVLVQNDGAKAAKEIFDYMSICFGPSRHRY
jgi:hypothetical protein